MARLARALCPLTWPEAKFPGISYPGGLGPELWYTPQHRQGSWGHIEPAVGHPEMLQIAEPSERARTAGLQL